MESAKYNLGIIELHVNHLEKYLYSAEKIECSNAFHKEVIIYNGFKSVVLLLSILHLINMPEEQINSYLEKSYILYVEYSEQVYLKKTDSYHTPTMFVYNVLIGNISLNAYTNTEKQISNASGIVPFMRQLSVWNELLLYWDNKHLTTIQRIYFVKNFIQSYLLLFTTKQYFELFRVFEKIQSFLKEDEKVFDKYCYLLTSFHKYVSKLNIEFNQQIVEDLVFDKFMRNREKFEEMFYSVENIKHMDDLIEWVFT
jgi:hypothetical protein